MQQPNSKLSETRIRHTILQIRIMYSAFLKDSAVLLLYHESEIQGAVILAFIHSPNLCFKQKEKKYQHFEGPSDNSRYNRFIQQSYKCYKSMVS